MNRFHRKLRPGFAAAVLFAAAACCLGPVASGQGDVPDLVLSFTEEDSLPLPPGGWVTGLTFMGPDTLVVLTDTPDSVSVSGDREVRLVFQDRGGRVLMQEDFTGVCERGLAWDGEFLYSCGDAPDGSSILYKIRVDTLQVDGAFNTLGHRPTDLCYDGSYIWITDRDAGRVDRFDPEVDEITRSVLTPGFSPCGVAWDGSWMWVTDSGTGRMYRLSGGRRNWSATISPESYLHRGHNVLLLGDNKAFWYVPPGSSHALKIRIN